MKILHQDGFNQAELLQYRQIVHRNLIDSAKALVQHLKDFEILPANPEIQVSTLQLPLDTSDCAQTDMEYITDFTIGDADTLDPQIFQSIEAVWRDNATPRLFTEHQSEFYMMDSAEYFFENCVRISDQEYIPTNDDILRARVTTTGIIETRFEMGNLSIQYLSFPCTPRVELANDVIVCLMLAVNVPNGKNGFIVSKQ